MVKVTVVSPPVMVPVEETEQLSDPAGKAVADREAHNRKNPKA